MKLVRLKVFFLFVTFFAIQFYFWHPHLREDALDLDMWEHYHDSFYREGWLKPFDFRIMTQSLGSNTYYFPLITILSNILYSTFGYHALPFWILGFLLFCVNVILVYTLSQSLLRDETAAFISATLFWCHPANLKLVSEVTWSLGQQLVTPFYLATLIFFLKFLTSPQWIFYWTSLFFFLLACLTRIFALIFTLTAPVMHSLLFKGRQKSPIDFYFPFFLVTLIFSGISMMKYPTSAIVQQWGGFSLGEFSFLRLFDFMTWLFFPFHANFSRPLYLVIAAFLLMLVLLLWGNSLVRFLSYWILVSLIPFAVSNFRETADLYRYLYFATIPFSILTAYGVSAGIRSIRERFVRTYAS